MRESSIAPDDLEDLEQAVRILERGSFMARLTTLAGRPIELLGSAVPPVVSHLVVNASTKGIEASLGIALRTIGRTPRLPSRAFHTALATASGAAGGAFGMIALPVELPLSTIIMMRAIVEIARQQGEDLSDPASALACVQVFALGARDPVGGSSDTRYFAVRSMLAASITEASRFLLERGVADRGSPVLVRFIGQVASRFGVTVTQKLALQAIPVIGALGGAAVNYAFAEHFQELARAHFNVRRMERIYSPDLVHTEYERLSRVI
jgi:hypothetical protein